MKHIFPLFLVCLPGGLAAQCNPDVQPPQVIAFNGLAFPVSPLTYTATVNAAALAMQVSDNCDGTPTIQLALRKAGTGSGFPLTPAGAPQTALSFFCNELGVRSLELWARDQAGNAAFVPAAVIIQDNSGACLPSALDSLCAFFQPGQVVQHISWVFDGVPPDPPLPPFADYTTESCFLIRDFWEDYSAADPNWTVYPRRDETGCNGVDALDLYRIHRHILGVEPLDHPLKMIAADVNNSQSMTTFDLVEIRRLLLGIYGQNPNKPAWKFFRTDSLPGAGNPANPFQNLGSLPLSVRLGQLENQNIDFTGIRIGDVDFSASPAYPPVVTPPGGPAVYLHFPDQPVTAGDTVLIPFSLSQAQVLAAMQINLQFDTNLLRLVEPVPGIFFSFPLNMFGVFTNRLTAVAYGYFPELIPAQEPLFTLKMLALQDGSLAQAFALLNSGCPVSAAYDGDLKALALGLQAGGSSGTPAESTGGNRCRVYPSPASDVVWVNTQWSAGDLLRFDISSFAAGFYVLHLVDSVNGRYYTLRFSKF